MSTGSELDRLLKETSPFMITRDFRGIVFSDLHLGVKDPADDFAKNETVFNRAYDYYADRDYKPFFLGDVVDLWENKKFDDIQAAYPSVFRRIRSRRWIKGNHDQQLDEPEAIVLQYETGEKILMVHGHQGDFFNSTAYPLSKFFVRYVWRNLQYLGFKDPTTASPRNPKKHEATKKKIKEWAFDRKQIVIFGHTHAPEVEPPYYFNCGSWVGEGGQGIEICGNLITLRKFSGDNPKERG